MIEIEPFTAGLLRIGVALRQPADEATLEVYFEALCDETEAEEWTAFCRTAVKRCGWKFLPSVVQLLDALREFRGEPSLDSEAVTAYERVLAAGSYTPDGGTSWSYRGVLAACGRAAADAFVEAGGNSAFATTWDEAKRRERFLASYQQEARAEPRTRLLAAPEAPKALIAGDVESKAGAADAAILRQIEERAQSEGFVKRPVKIDMDDPVTRARLAELRAQGERIVAEEQGQESEVTN